MTPEQKAAEAVDRAAMVEGRIFSITGTEAVEALSAAGLVVVTAARVAELLDANSALVAERRSLRAELDAMAATIDAQGEALVGLKRRAEVAEKARDEAMRLAGEMLPRRIEAERQRDEARRQLPALRLALGLNPEA